jgi:hypothetical protein
MNDERLESWPFAGELVKRKSPVRSLHQLIIPDDDILQAISDYVPLDDVEEGRAVYAEAQCGNKVAEFIIGMALLKANRKEAARTWLGLSAEQGFGPAIQHLKMAG